MGTEFSYDKLGFSIQEQFELTNVLIRDQKQDSLLYVENLLISINPFKLKENQLYFSHLKINNPRIRINKSIEKEMNYQFLIDSLFRGNMKKKVVLKTITLSNAEIDYDDHSCSSSFGQLDLNCLHINNLYTSLSINEIEGKKIDIELYEFILKQQDGIHINDLYGHIIKTESSLDLKKFGLITDKSHVKINELTIFNENGL
ncbi:MAG: hypothetical protein IJ270_07430 [Paludibacteraceae bacterium]|nr:hypothetical protein [Paludibacteraceae bacterium]